MNEYRTMKERHQDEVNNFPLGFAFGDKQFEEMMQKWGLDAKNDADLAKVAHLYAGAYILKKDIPAYKDMSKRHYEELQAAIAADTTGEGFIFHMFYDELCNHEYGYTGDCNDTLEALGYSADDIMSNPALKRGLEKAATLIMKQEG